MEQILALLEKDCRLTPAQLAVMLGLKEEDVAAAIRKYEAEGVILGYNALIDWDKTNREYVSAVIELKVSSSGYDLQLLIDGKTMKEVAYFVANKLATLESVVSTATHFVLKKYKDKGVVYGTPESDEREQAYYGLQ